MIKNKNMTPSQADAQIISNLKIAKNYYLLSLEVSAGFKDAQPGQFVHIKIDDSYEPLLRRPFSIHRLTFLKSKSKFNLDILYELKGRGTRLLAEKKAGECLNILGPLGKGFEYRIQCAKDETHIVIAGGAGVAPLFFLAHKISQAHKGKEDRDVVLIGAATAGKILCEKEFKELGCGVNIATEDGSQGFKGNVAELFEKKILSGREISSRAETKNKIVNVYACGPQAMLTALAKICLIKKLPLQVSLEEFMGCGIGACLGCAIETKTGYKRVCHDGPVFCAQDIVWRF